MMREVVFGLKALGKQKGFTAAALLTLALCIGANTAIFTVLQAVVLRPLPYADPHELATLFNVYPGVGVERGANAVPDYLDRRKMTDVFSEVALIGYTGYDVGMEGSPQRIRGQYVTPSFFTVLGTRPLLGRTFLEEEATLGKERVAILTEELWRDMFARDPKAVGRDIRLSGNPYRIVGVLPAKFGIGGGGPEDAQIYTSFAFRQEQTTDNARHSNNWGMIARLKRGVSLAQAQERIGDLNRRNLDLVPQFRQLMINARFGTRVAKLQDELVREIRPTLYLLQIAVGVVLLIGCVNLANLMLVRSNVRMKELAIRYSLGAGRWRIARQLLTESVLLALMGGVLAMLVGAAGVRLLARLGATELPRGAGIGIDAGVLAFTAAISVIAGLAFGMVPLVHVLRRDLTEVFRGNERTGTAGRSAISMRSVLVVCQVAFAFVLLAGAGLLTRSFAQLMRVNPGFDPESVATARISMPQVRYGETAQARNALGEILSRASAIPGVRHAAATSYLPFGGGGNASVITIVGYTLGPGENPPVLGWNTIGGDYFKAMGIPLLEGRSFSESDGPDSEKVVIVDEDFARRYWPRGGAVGAKITRGMKVGDNPAPDVCTIVGVVGSVKAGDLTETNPGQIYFHYRQYLRRDVHLVMKTGPGGQQAIPALRSELLRIDPELPLYDVRTMAERLSRSLASRRAAMALCLAFAGLALLLAAIGIYGVLAYYVSQRTREFGIRSALGADSRHVLGMVLGQGVRMAAVGLALGAAGAAAATRLMTAMLFGVRPSDPGVFAAVALVLAGVACLASLIPSARAVRIPPATALRYE